MLYHLLYPFRSQSGPECHRVHHVPHGRGEPVGAGDQPFLGPWMIRKLREFQIGQVIQQEGPTTHRPKAGDADEGRALNS